ncbi:hypothetical protein JOB18_048361 [Solea senegalensis]|uniref:Uncharacterized protein n=1 Tax=Solea senegalensis TaxID=28829 RepID=A0AAV6RQU7_SOLSE|nr:hypothetical protein JOB18_048361 [Solea senegalensis]
MDEITIKCSAIVDTKPVRQQFRITLLESEHDELFLSPAAQKLVPAPQFVITLHSGALKICHCVRSTSVPYKTVSNMLLRIILRKDDNRKIQIQIVEEPPVAEVKTKWQALFTEQQIEAEFTRITSVDLRGSFFSGLGQHLPRLLQLYRASSFPELKNVLSMLEEDISNQTRRAVFLRGLPYFLCEDPSKFLRTAEPTDMDDSMTRGMNVGIVLVKEGEDLLDISVVLEE